ncbi:MAG: chemotaxis protein CheB [Thermodesulfobacteriota bacterium]
MFLADRNAGARTLIRGALSADPEVKVAAEASSLKLALASLARSDPDVMVLGPNGLGGRLGETVQEMLAISPKPLVVLCPAPEDADSPHFAAARQAGALLCLPMPSAGEEGAERAAALLDAVRTVSGIRLVRRRGATGPARADAPRRSYRLVAMAASTGGPPAIQQILSGLGPAFPAPILVAQHMSRGFVQGFARYLAETTGVTVSVARQGEALAPGRVYLAPDDFHLLALPGLRASISDKPPVDGHRPSATVLFESVARHYGPSAVGVLLTGMGGDGARGLSALRAAGGFTICQDSDTSLVFGMPKKAVELNAARLVLPLSRIAPELLRLFVALNAQK